ncbi:MAG: UDP-N-acetylglucosamine 4,6-dehydratase/5-epimerase [Thermococcaceae archaeon]|jgi:UDP-N-acetylglucosamine 4,6-dehydratase|nr:UDP-N-acetylglucosamine 4,6-dehydratase/5-epimerase [Thermococcaceae archaeon]
MSGILDNKVILITGGTGSFGKKFTERIFQEFEPEKVIIFSRDEYKQYVMRKKFPPEKYPIRYFIGDVRDRERLYRAFDGVDYVVHAAALKQVPVAEYNPFEAVKTNIIGAQNVIDAAIDMGVKKAIGLSTDKAVNPINLYGATKLVLEKIFIAGNAYVGKRDTTFSVVRYGNVVGSRGSVIPLFLELVKGGKKKLPITDLRMTRFWLTLDEAVDLVLFALRESVGGEVFVPKVPSMRIVDLAKAICPECEFEIIGIRPGEKLHETLISEDEARNTVVFEDSKTNRMIYIILPQFEFESKNLDKWKKLPKVPEGFVYRSDKNDWWLTVEELKEMIKDVKVE